MTNCNHNLQRLYLPITLSKNSHVLLPDDQSHYLRNVLRKIIGDKIRVFNSEYGEFLAIVESISKKSIGIEIVDVLRTAENLPTTIHLFFSPLKKDRMDMVIEKAVELGATHLHPVLFSRTIIRDIKPDRINAQIIEAAEQCERMNIPVLLPLVDVKKCLIGWDNTIPLFAALERHQQTKDIKTVVKTSNNFGYLVGPEGGITEEEMIFLLNQKFIQPVSLGPRILRAETAVFYGLSVLG